MNEFVIREQFGNGKVLAVEPDRDGFYKITIYVGEDEEKHTWLDKQEMQQLADWFLLISAPLENE